MGSIAIVVDAPGLDDLVWLGNAQHPSEMIGQSMLISAGQNFGLIMRYGAVEYPGEHFAYDGSEVTIANISPGQRSPLGDFLYRYNGLIKEGLLSGVLSTGWALLDIEKNKPGLAFNQAKVDGQELYAIDYSPKTDLNDIKVKLFFDPDTFHHVRTEYRLVVHGEQSLLSSTPYSHGAPKSKNAWNMSSRYATAAEAGGYIQGVNILDEINDSIYVLIEKFDKFKEIEFKSAKSDQAMRLTLPQKYTIEYSTQGQGSTFLGIWDINAVQWIQNGTIDASFFEAQR